MMTSRLNHPHRTKMLATGLSLLGGLLLIALAYLSAPAGATDGSIQAAADSQCAPLGLPSGNIINVAEVGTLVDAVNNAVSGDTILLADGLYDLQGNYLRIDTPGVTLRSASGNREAVILDGGYQTTEIIQAVVSDVTIADLTLQRAVYHPIHVTAGDSANTENTLIYNVHVIDPGQQAIKINANGAKTHYADNGVVACSHIELTDAGRPKIWEINNSCYTGGIDGHQAWGWVIRDNLIEGFWCENGLSEHGIHFWTGSRDTLVERNILRDNARGVGFGLLQSGDWRTYGGGLCGGATDVGHYDGIIRNNFVFQGRPELQASQVGFECHICLEQACGAKVLHNSLISTAAPALSSVEWRFANTNAEITNNLVSHSLLERDGATATLTGNLSPAPLSLFVDGAGGDLHLTATASTAIDQGLPIAQGMSSDDIDAGLRDATPDVGADEFGADGTALPLKLTGRAADRTLYLSWTVNTTLPLTSTWHLAYQGPGGDQPSPITNIISPTRSYTLTGLTNYIPYTITLNGMLNSAPFLTDTVTLMPTDIFVYLPAVLKN